MQYHFKVNIHHALTYAYILNYGCRLLRFRLQFPSSLTIVTLSFSKVTHIKDGYYLQAFFLLFLSTLGLGCISDSPYAQRRNVGCLPYRNVAIGADKEAHTLGMILALVVLCSLQRGVEYQRAQLTVSLCGQFFQFLLQVLGYLQFSISYTSRTVWGKM